MPGSPSKMAVKTEGVLWMFSILLRFLWTLYPQTGYIHPDEFFQSPEVTAGDVLGLQTLRAWEFNETFPIRTAVFPYLSTGIPFWILRILTSHRRYESVIPTSRTLLILPRISFCCISLLVDFSGYGIARIMQIDPALVLCIIGTSYVSIVFHTRPFSNSLESALFALLLWAVIGSISKETLKLQAPWQDRLGNFWIGVLVTAGFWNRPTFLGFAFIPVLSWLYKLYKNRCHLKASQLIISIMVETMFTILGVIISAVIFIMVDSIYFDHIRKGKLVFSPLNFLKYNLLTSNIKEHGLHPRFTHFLVNLPLLYGALSIVLFQFLIHFLLRWDFSMTLSNFLMTKGSTNKEPTTKTEKRDVLLYVTLLFSVLTSIGFLSIMPHQEPRFILPVLLPLAILFSHLIIGPKASMIAKASWISWNIFGCIIFGMLHQGGVTSCLGHLQGYLSNVANSPTQGTSFHLVFSNTYMPPRYLLSWPCSETEGCEHAKHKLRVHDLGGQSEAILLQTLEHIIHHEKKETKRKGTNFQLFVICPSKLRFYHRHFIMDQQFTPHLSMENPPDLASLFHPTMLDRESCRKKFGKQYVDSSTSNQYCDSSRARGEGDSSYFLFKWLRSEMSLNLYKYQPNSK